MSPAATSSEASFNFRPPTCPCPVLWHPYSCCLFYSSDAGNFYIFSIYLALSSPSPPPAELPITTTRQQPNYNYISLPNQAGGMALLGLTLLTQRRDTPTSDSCPFFHSHSFSGWKGKEER